MRLCLINLSLKIRYPTQNRTFMVFMYDWGDLKTMTLKSLHIDHLSKKIPFRGECRL